jgi:ABC-type transport system involved in multi-copper enzyme maturation permease subunit
MRWGPGPVFIYECLTSSRRLQTYAARSLVVSVLLLAMASIAWSNGAMMEGKSTQEYASLGEAYFYALIGVALALVILTAPAATAGAICMDRSRGALQQVLITDLSDTEIVVGKLAARLLPVLGLVACAWPVLAITSLLGGIDPIALTLAFAVILDVALLGCTFALALSVWARKPHEVVLVTYTCWFLGLLVWPIWIGLSTTKLMIVPPYPWVPLTNPFYVAFAPYAVPGQVGSRDYTVFFAVSLGVSGLFTALAVHRMRPVACRSTGEKRSKPGLGWLGWNLRQLPGPSLDGNPVFWREWYRSRPSPWALGLLLLVGGSTGVACVAGAVRIWVYHVDPSSSDIGTNAGVAGYMIQVLFGLLMLSAAAPMAMSEERQRGSLDVLTATPLSAATIVVGKWWGTFRLVPLLTVGPGLMALALATAKKPPAPGFVELTLGYRLFAVALLISTIAAHGALLTSVGLALAIWMKRQSRAIAVSVTVFVLVAIAWPTFVNVFLAYPLDEGLALLSPVYDTADFADMLTIRADHFRGELWWVAFWDIEVTLWAIGLLWLTVGTFDRCVGRIAERPGPSPVVPNLIVIWAGTTAVACAGVAVRIWPQGIAAGQWRSKAQLAGTSETMAFLVVASLALSILAPILVRAERRRFAVTPRAAAGATRVNVGGSVAASFCSFRSPGRRTGITGPRPGDKSGAGAIRVYTRRHANAPGNAAIPGGPAGSYLDCSWCGDDEHRPGRFSVVQSSGHGHRRELRGMYHDYTRVAELRFLVVSIRGRLETGRPQPHPGCVARSRQPGCARGPASRRRALGDLLRHCRRGRCHRTVAAGQPDARPRR